MACEFRELFKKKLNASALKNAGYLILRKWALWVLSVHPRDANLIEGDYSRGNHFSSIT
jgi:hypothetical protein